MFLPAAGAWLYRKVGSGVRMNFASLLRSIGFTFGFENIAAARASFVNGKGDGRIKNDLICMEFFDSAEGSRRLRKSHAAWFEKLKVKPMSSEV